MAVWKVNAAEHTDRRLPPYIPTSVALARLLKAAPADRVSLAWLIGQLEMRSFGLFMLILATVGLLPGVALLAAILLPFPAIQMIMGRETPSLPRALAALSIPSWRFSRWIVWAIPHFARIEAFIRPRWHTPFQTTKRVIGLIVLILAVTLLAPFPFNIIPTLAIMMISLAYLEEDGVFLCISLVAAVLSVLVTAGAVLAAAAALGLIETSPIDYLHRVD